MPGRRSHSALAFAAWPLACLLLSCAYPPEDEVALCDAIVCSAGRCVVEGGEPQCVCGAREQALGLTCSIVGDERGDEFGDTPEEAAVLAVPVLDRQGAFQFRKSGSDVDVFATEAHAGGIYRLTCTLLSAEACTARVTDAQGRWLGSVVGGMDAPGGSVLQVEAPSTGLLYWSLRSFQPGAYRFTLEETGTDEHPDTRAEAVARTPSVTPIAGALEMATDKDVFAFAVTAGHTVRVSWQPGTLSAASIGSQYGEEIQSTTEWTEPFSELHFMSTTGLLFLEVSVSKGRTGTYSVTVEDLGPDDHGDAAATATPLVPSMPAEGTVLHEDDLDVFTFHATAGRLYEVRCEHGTLTRCDLHCFDAGHVYVSFSGIPGNDGLDTRTYVDQRQDGPVFCEVRSHTSLPREKQFGTYRIQFLDGGPEPLGDSKLEAMRVGTGSHPGAFETPGDQEDWLTVDAVLGEVFRAREPGAEGNVSLQVESPAGPLLIHGSSFTSRYWKAPMDAALALRLTPSRWFGKPVPYTLMLESLGVDDHGDTAQEATALALGVTSQARMDWPSDSDAFRVSLEAGRTYHLTANGRLLSVSIASAASGTVLTTRGNVSVNSPVQFAFEATAGAGDYVVTVRGGDFSEANSMGSYSLTVSP